MNRKQLYNDLCQHLSAITVNGNQVFKDLDLWNEQLQNKESKFPYKLPAIFIQFSPINWRSFKTGIKEGDVDISLIIMSSTKGARTKYNSQFKSSALSRLDYPDLIARALYNFKPIYIENQGETNETRTQYASTFMPIRTEQSFNYEDVVADIEVYRTRLKDVSGRNLISQSLAGYDLNIDSIELT